MFQSDSCVAKITLKSQKNVLGLAPSNERTKVKRSQRIIICNPEHLSLLII